jgi:integrase
MGQHELPAALAALPFAPILELVLDGLASPHSRRSYALALARFLDWYEAAGRPGLSKATVQRYRTHLDGQSLAASSLNVHMSAIRKLAYEAADNGLIAPELAAGIGRVRGAKRQGIRAGNWLTPAEATALLNAPERGAAIGCRDRALLGFLLGCGLRRAELVSLDVGHIQLRDAGKGQRLRTVPVPAWVKLLLDSWLQRAGIEAGPIFRPVNKGGQVLASRISEDTVWKVVRRYGAEIGQPELAPHDARRTCAKLCRAAGGELEQIQLLLGHASVLTTERYLGTRQNLAQAVNDHLPLEPD